MHLVVARLLVVRLIAVRLAVGSTVKWTQCFGFIEKFWRAAGQVLLSREVSDDEWAEWKRRAEATMDYFQRLAGHT